MKSDEILPLLEVLAAFSFSPGLLFVFVFLTSFFLSFCASGLGLVDDGVCPSFF